MFSTLALPFGTQENPTLMFEDQNLSSEDEIYLDDSHKDNNESAAASEYPVLFVVKIIDLSLGVICWLIKIFFNISLKHTNQILEHQISWHWSFDTAQLILITIFVILIY